MVKNTERRLQISSISASILLVTGVLLILCGLTGTTVFADIAGWSSRNTIDGTCSDPYDVTTADFDNDKDMDIAVAELQQVIWYENTGGQSYTERTVTGSLTRAVCIQAVNIDGDGDIDILGADETLNYIFWCENDGTPADGEWTKYVISDNFSGARSVFAIDIDSDDDVDILAAANSIDVIAWWENDGSQNFSYHAVDKNFSQAYDVYAADINGDNAIDIVGAGNNAAITWWENDGSQNFTSHVIDTGYTSSYSVYAADIDGDTNIDIAASGVAESLTWWANDGTPEDGGWIAANLSDSYNCWSVQAVDLDSDNDTDILTGDLTGKVEWWNNDGYENFTAQTIDSDNFFPYSVHASDIDQDGWYDVVAVDSDNGILAWWENMNLWQGPVPPVPELPALVLLGSGLVVLAGYILLRQRKQAKTTL
jgi:hypothetical protein